MDANTKTAKDKLNDLMIEMFGMIEDLQIQEGAYLKFADMFKEMNMNVTRLAEMKTELGKNSYYQRYVRVGRPSPVRQKLSEAEKRASPHWTLCDCGRLVKKDGMKEHLETQVHYQGRRNRKYAGKCIGDDDINFQISREIVLHGMLIKQGARL